MEFNIRNELVKLYLEGAWLACFPHSRLALTEAASLYNTMVPVTGPLSALRLTVRHAANRAESATRRVGLNFTIAVILLVIYYLLALNPLFLAVLPATLKPITAALPWLCSPFPRYYRIIF